jgi:hypothetical protein
MRRKMRREFPYQGGIQGCHGIYGHAQLVSLDQSLEFSTVDQNHHLLWLVINKKSLTWDIILKRGFENPSIFLMFSQAGEKLNHLLNSYRVASKLWDKDALFFHTSEKNR